MNLKDYILDEIPEKEQEVKTPRAKTEYVFTITYENDCDFILTKKTQKTERQLVCLISQAQIYIKDIKKNEIDKVTSIEQINSFRRGMEHLPNFLKLRWQPFSTKWYSGIESDGFWRDMLRNLEAVKALFNKKMNPYKHRSLITEYRNNPLQFNSRESVMRALKVLKPDYEGGGTDNGKITNLFIECNIDINTIKKHKELLLDVGVDDVIYNIFPHAQFLSAIKNYNCDFKTLIEYFLYTIKNRNGLQIGTYGGQFTIHEYVDYLRMQQEMYGKVKEKYPQYWLSEKQMMINKYNKWQEFKKLHGFSLEQEKLSFVEFENHVYRVIVPINSSDILDEASQQQHCVGSYIKKIQKGETNIVFIREKHAPETSCLTVQITNNKVVQVKGFQNRSYTAMEYDFMVKWCEDKNLELGVNKVV